ncbi:HAD family hydrolase [Rossellomorea sp. AcN35-11]|nr:HAD family hydrolase [Rossellomorea aquimaris]WJV28662.1 HAD family hydrolase [Rossellomorea sp. AcN35-11]
MNYLKIEDFDLLLFDLDDTLFDHSKAVEKGVKDTLQQFSILQKVNPDDFHKTFIKHNHKLWGRFSSKDLNFHEFSLRRLEDTLKEFNIFIDEEESLAFVKEFQSSYLNRIRPIQELNDLLFELGKIVNMGIVTNGTAFNAYEKVHRLGLTSIFPESSVIISENVGYTKPDEEIFQHTLNVFEACAERTLFIGDNYYTDINGGKTLGLTTIWINKMGYECPEERPDFMVKSVLEFKDLLTKEGER